MKSEPGAFLLASKLVKPEEYSCGRFPAIQRATQQGNHLVPLGGTGWMRPWPNSSYLHVGSVGVARSTVHESDIRLPWLQEGWEASSTPRTWEDGHGERGNAGFSRQTNQVIWGLKEDLNNDTGIADAVEQTEKEIMVKHTDPARSCWRFRSRVSNLEAVCYGCKCRGSEQKLSKRPDIDVSKSASQQVV